MWASLYRLINNFGCSLLMGFKHNCETAYSVSRGQWKSKVIIATEIRQVESFSKIPEIQISSNVVQGEEVDAETNAKKYLPF